MASDKALLGAADYIIFTLMLLVSAGIGLFFRFSGGKQKTMNEYFLAGKNMPVLPVAFSVMASYLSSITVIGGPAEVYVFGINLLYTLFSYPIGIAFVSYVCLPVFFKLGSCTAYEYLERRFGKVTRLFTSAIFMFQTILYVSVVLYAPALALSAATSLSTWTSVISIGVVCTFYCTLGGMKAVIWTDLFQALLMFLGVLTVLIKGFWDIGFEDVFRISYEGGRIPMPGWSLSLTERYTVWNIFLHGCSLPLIAIGANQIQIQRLLTLKTISRCRKSLYFGIILFMLFNILTYCVGLVIYANFYGCDPITSPLHPISAADQLVPYYMIRSLTSLPGLTGLCICGVFAASLSTVSSAINSLAAVTMQDLVRPLLASRRCSESTMTLCVKVITIFYGALCIVMTVLASAFGTLVQATIIIYGLCGVPVLTVFLLGMLTTTANEKGALIGLLSSLFFTAWVSFGSAANGPRPKILPLSTEGCSANSFSDVISSALSNATASPLFSETSTPLNIPKVNPETPYIFPLYRMSFMWYVPFGIIIGLLVGYLSSIIINYITGENPDVAEELLSPVLLNLIKKKKDSKRKAVEIRLQAEEECLTSPSEILPFQCLKEWTHEKETVSK